MTPLLGCHPAHKTICLDHNHLNSPPACPEPLRDGLQKGKGICPVHLPASLNPDQLCSELFQSTAIARQRDLIVDLCVSVGGGDETESVSAITVAQDKLRSATCVNAEHLYRPDHEPKLYRGKSVSQRSVQWPHIHFYLQLRCSAASSTSPSTSSPYNHLRCHACSLAHNQICPIERFLNI